MSDDTAHGLRSPCKCGSWYGRIDTRGGQDCVFCAECGGWQYNAPRLETGRDVRSLSTRPGITPSQRFRVLDAHGHQCVSCGATGSLQLDHLISRDDAERAGCLDELIDSEWNLAPMCPECNSGKRSLGTASIRLMYRCLLIKATPR